MRIHVMMPSSCDSVAYAAVDVVSLYYNRWCIKSIQTAQVSYGAGEHIGLSWLVAWQDFGAKIVADNLYTLMVLEVKKVAGLKESYKANPTHTFTHHLNGFS